MVEVKCIISSGKGLENANSTSDMDLGKTTGGDGRVQDIFVAEQLPSDTLTHDALGL